MKNPLARLTVFVLSSCLFYSGLSGQQAQESFANGVAAQVNSRIITVDDLRKELVPLVPQIRSSSSNSAMFRKRISELSREVVQNLIDRLLIVQEFEDLEYSIPETFLQTAFNDYLTREFSGDRAAFLSYLRVQGKSELDFRKELKEDLIISFMRRQRTPDRSGISPAKIQEYYDQNRERFFEQESIRLRLIQLRPRAGNTMEKLNEQASLIIQQLGEGADFAELARKYSSDDKADQGGDWGWIGREMLKKELSDVAFRIEVGKYSQPVTSGQSIYIFKVEEVRKTGVKSIDEVRSEIEEAISARITRQETEEWLQGLRRDAYIKVFLPEVLTFFDFKEPESKVEMPFGSLPATEPSSPESQEAAPPAEPLP